MFLCVFVCVRSYVCIFEQLAALHGIGKIHHAKNYTLIIIYVYF